MKIGVVGCGAVGSYYGALLCRTGHDVHFLLRSDYDVVRRRGVIIRSADGNFSVQPACARTPAEIGPCDVVLIGLKTTANDQFAGLLPPLAGPATAWVTLQNGLGNEEALAHLFPRGLILGGLCFVCLNRVEPGIIHHLGYGTVVLGEFERRPGPRTREVAGLLCDAGVNCKMTDDLEQAHWEKLVWNVPFNGLGVAGTAGLEAFEDDRWQMAEHKKLGLCLTTDKLLGEPRWEKLVRELMLEVIRAANAQGFPVPESLAEKQIERTRTMGAYKASTLIDFECGRPLEWESLFAEPLRRAQTAGLRTPRLERLCRVLGALASAGVRPTTA